MDTEVYSSSSEEETFELGRAFSERLAPGDLVAFHGELGSGKTEFIKGICEGLGVEEIVSSPTYTIVNQYVGEVEGREVDLYHVDLYRIERSEELREIGLEEMIADPRGVMLVEWAENAEGILPSTRWEVHFTTLEEENRRRIEIALREAPLLERAVHIVGRR